MKTSNGPRLSLAEIQIVKLKTEREQRGSGLEKREDASADLARQKRTRIETESKQLDAQLDAAATKSPFAQALGSLVTGLAETVGDITDAVEDVASKVSPELGAVLGVTAGLMVGHIAAAASMLSAALPVIASKVIGVSVGTMTIGKVVDATANAVALGAGSRANDLRKTLDRIDALILELESSISSDNRDKTAEQADTRRSKQQLRQALDEQMRTVQAHMAAMRGDQVSALLGNQIPAGVRAAQVAQAVAADLDANGMIASVADMQRQIEAMKEQSLALRVVASDKQWANEKLRTWVDFGAAWLEVAATVLTAGASASATAAASATTTAAAANAQLMSTGLQLGQSAVSLGSGGLGIASAFITDKDVDRKFRAAEGLDNQAAELQRSVDLAKTMATGLRIEADQHLDRAVDGFEAFEGTTPAAATGRAALEAQAGIMRGHLDGLRDSSRRRFEAAGRAVRHSEAARMNRIEGDGAKGTQNDWQKGLAIASGAISAIGVGVSASNFDTAVGAVDATADALQEAKKAIAELKDLGDAIQVTGRLVTSGVRIAPAAVDAGAKEEFEAELEGLEADREQRHADDARDQLTRRQNEYRRSYDAAVAIGRNMAPSRA